jgi:hypothetical protein
VDILTIATSIGLDAAVDAVGTIDERVVLDALDRLAAEHPATADRCCEAQRRVRAARSAGAESVDADSVFASRGTVLQLRYRSEMWEIFVDLAIDLALSEAPVGAVEGAPAPVA